MPLSRLGSHRENNQSPRAGSKAGKNVRHIAAAAPVIIDEAKSTKWHWHGGIDSSIALHRTHTRYFIAEHQSKRPLEIIDSSLKRM